MFGQFFVDPDGTVPDGVLGVDVEEPLELFVELFELEPVPEFAVVELALCELVAFDVLVPLVAAFATKAPPAINPPASAPVASTLRNRSFMGVHLLLRI